MVREAKEKGNGEEQKYTKHFAVFLMEFYPSVGIQCSP